MYRREYESQRVRDKDYARHVAERVKPVNSANEFNVARAPCGIWADALDVVGDGELVVFFFQAEDGIRDADVTGVHTCALPIFTRDEVKAALDRMAAEITALIGNKNPLLLSVLNGGIIPTAELALRLRFPLEIDSIKAGRYQGETRGNEIRWLLKPTIPLRRRTVLIIDDVLDEGITLAEIRKYCS